MKKGRFLWSAYRITEKQKAGKAQNIKEKQLQNSRSTVSRQLVARLSSASADSFGLRPQPREFYHSRGFLSSDSRSLRLNLPQRAAPIAENIKNHRPFGGDFLSSAADPACWTFQALVEPIDRGGDKNVLPST